MTLFKYTAHNPAGDKPIKGQVEAVDERSAAKALADQGLSPIKIKAPVRNSLLSRFQNRISTKEKVIFARQLSTLVNASLPLLQSLRMVATQTSNKALNSVINQVADDVEGGMPLAKSLVKFPDVFSQVFVGVVAAGEASGTLDASLERLALQMERDADIVSKVKGAAIYPLIVLVVMLGVITFMIVKVLPQVQDMYSGLGAKLPFITQFLLDISHFIIHYWWIMIAATLMAAYFIRRWMQTDRGAWRVDGWKMEGPIVGPLFKKLYMARFTRIASTLLAAGLPLLQVLQITAGVIDNRRVATSINNAAEKVRGGKALSASLEKDPNFLDLVPNMIHIGEQSGALETMMTKTAEYYEKEVEEQVDTLSTTVEPLLMVIMGGLALLVVAAILLPIYGLVGKNINVL